MPGTWRRRLCPHCSALFTTRESVDLSETHVVQTKDAGLVAFSRDKLFLSLYRSCGHRKTALSDADALTNTIIQRLIDKPESRKGNIKPETITAIAKDTLTRFDRVAATYYEAYHK